MNSQIEDKSELSKPRFIFEEHNEFIKKEASIDEELNSYPIIKTVKTEQNEAMQNENPHFPIEADFNFKVEIQPKVLQAPETAKVTKHNTSSSSENYGDSAIPYPIKNEFPIETKTVKENFEPIIENIEIDTIKSEEHETNPSMLLPRDDYLSCSYCKFETKDLATLVTHRNECCYKIPYAVQTVNQVKDVEQGFVACDHCEHQTSEKRYLIVHIHSQHTSMQKEDMPRIRRNRLQTKLKYSCCFCDAKFTTKQKREEHIKAHSKWMSHRTIKKKWLLVDRSNQNSEKVPTCNLCMRQYGTMKGLKDHYKNIHDKRKIEFVCDNCRDSFPQKSHIIMHLKAKICEGGLFTANADAACDYDMYLAKDTGKKHSIKRMAARAAEYTCHECSFKCEHPISLKEHMRVHCVKRRHKKSAKQYSCQFCKFKALSEDVLNEHILKDHEHEKPYFCKLCDCKYSLMNNLVKHIKSHFLRR